MTDKYHILPLNDKEPHTEAETCRCNPKVERANDTTVVIHNAFDGRELQEGAAANQCGKLNDIPKEIGKDM